MTMRNPLDGELQMVPTKFDHAKRYRYTWPGQQPKIVSGAELAAICKGADPTKLDIAEVTDAKAIDASDTAGSKR